MTSHSEHVSSLKRHVRNTTDVSDPIERHGKHRKLDDTKMTFCTFQTTPRHRFDQAFPYFRNPEENGSFSQDSKREFRHDQSQKRYYVSPSNVNHVHFDLKDGYKNLIRKDESKKEFINDMLRWIMLNREKFALSTSCQPQERDAERIESLHTDFICWRGLLTRLLCTPYENRDGWIIAVTLFKGTYYLCEFETEERRRQKESTTERQDEICYGGWKFEQYLTAETPGGVPDTSNPVNNNEGFCSVVRTRLSKHSLVFGGEVDAIDQTVTSKNKYVELKTSREMDTPRQEENFCRFKLIKWWAQSFLIGIPRIICGFRDDDGIVHRLQEYKTLDIPNYVKKIRDPWQAAVCFNFLDQFLGFLKKTVTVDNPRTVHVCRWQTRQDVQCERMEEGSEFMFLPDWYINWEAWR